MDAYAALGELGGYEAVLRDVAVAAGTERLDRVREAGVVEDDVLDRLGADVSGRAVADAVDRVEVAARRRARAVLAVAEAQRRVAGVVDLRDELGRERVAREEVALGQPAPIVLDSDGDIDPEAIGPFLALMKLYRLDIVLGSKRHPMSEVNYPAVRRVMSWVYHKVARVLFLIDVRDTQTGFKVIRRDVLRAVLPRMLEKRYAFDLELLVIARLLGYRKVFEAPQSVDDAFWTAPAEPRRYAPFQVLYAGRLTSEKGADLLAEAFLRAHAHDPRLHLVLAGGGPEEHALRERLGPHSTFLGWLGSRELARVYASADVFLFASRTDTFGQVILEAQASGLPVVAVAEGGPLSLIEDGRTGRLCPPDPDALADAVVELARSPGLRAQLAHAGHAAVRERTWECALERLAAGYRRALGEDAGQAVARRTGTTARRTDSPAPVRTVA